MSTAPTIELNRLRRPPPLAAVRFFTEEHPSPSSHGPHDAYPPYDGEGEGEHGEHSEADAIRPPWKRELYQLLEQPTSSRAAFMMHMCMTLLIVFSAFVTVLETVPDVHSISSRVWFGVETSVVALFTVEYAARCVAWSYTWSSLFSWILSFYGVIDLLSVLPYYLELLLQQDTSVFFRFSILRMFRLLRVFRPFRYNHTILLTIEVMYLSVRRSQHALLAIGFFVIMVLTVFSTLLYFAERGTWDELLGTFVNVDGDPTQFSSIPAAAWFVLVTITTVGYGEITPRSFLGRLITLPILVFGLLLITLPSFVLGREFSHVWEKMTQGQGLDRGEDDGRERYPSFNPSSPISPIYSARPRSAVPPSASASARGALSYTQNQPQNQGLRQRDPAPTARDLTNLKLAQNQTELSAQIEELAAAVEGQGRVLGRLMEMLQERGGLSAFAVGGTGTGGASASAGAGGSSGGNGKGSKES
ncbi:hypothetical protein GALMADRAFT_254051 [Galerina marginata CBS 339.88]|uniref:Ion transport domain-containing protein n=1 Tax=Galerina marginata (strain CBS 339.88) TaxID=685588 RepID=A0A067SU46_GALM3|nr:hypothetical protein GALMADRAFT_254051 [Galerina marginata CBS 339.88]